MVPRTVIEPWERREDESDRDWGFFVLYRDLHPSVRSIARTFALYQQQKHEAEQQHIQTSGLSYKAPSWFEAIATQNKWVARVRAYDEWRDQDQIERLQSTRVRFLVETAEQGRHLRQKAAEALQSLRVVAYEQVIGEDGDITTVATSTLSPAAIVQLLRAGAELERQAIGLGPAGGPGGVQVNIANVLGTGAGPGGHLPLPVSDDELMAKVLEVAQAKGVLVDGTVVTATPVIRPGEG